MAMIQCPECGKEISSLAPTCPNCGAPQQYIYTPPSEEPKNDTKMSNNKILSFIGLGIVLVGVVFGGLFAEIAAFVISLIVLNSDESEKDARTIAKISLIISIILMIIFVIYIFIAGSMLFSIYNRYL